MFYSILIPFVGCEINYKVVGRGPARLNSFTGTCVFDLKRAIKEQSQLPYPPDIIKLSVGKHNEAKKDLDVLEDLDENEVFDFKTLCLELGINKRNPISVELPSK